MATLIVNTLRNITGTDNAAAPISGDFVSVARNFNNAKVPASELRDAVDAFVLAKLAEKDATIATKDARITELQVDKDKLQTLVNSMGGTDEGKRLAKLARRQAALDAQAKAAAQLSAIDSEP